MAFDSDAMVEALSPPSFTRHGRTYVGRILSVEDWVRLHALSAAVNTLDVRALRRFTRTMILSWFPVRCWRAWLVKVAPDLFHPAWRAFRALPDKVQVAAIESFSRSQRNAMPSLGISRSQPPGTTIETPTTTATAAPPPPT